MKVLGLLNFYDEKPEHLTATIDSLHDSVDTLIAVDGAYRLFPNATAGSGSDAHDAILTATDEHGIACALHVPASPWQDNEIQKRTFLFALAHAHANPSDDWLLVIDADEVIVEAGDWRGQLEQADHDVGAILLGEQGVRPRLTRRLYRAHPRGIFVRDAHYYTVDGDGRVLQGLGQIDRVIVALRMLHRPLQRTPERIAARNAYYEPDVFKVAEPDPAF